VPVGAQRSPTPSIYPLAPSQEAASNDRDNDSAARTAAQFVKLEKGVTLPDRSTTPGSVFPDVTKVDICDQRYVRGIKQPRFNDKVAAFANYGISIHDRQFFQVDHLIPLALGGTNAMSNLWPQQYAGSRGAAAKDQLEGQLRGLVCSGTLTLKAAQVAIADNWWAAYGRYMGQPINPGSAGYQPGTASAPVTSKGVLSGLPCGKKGAVGYTDKNVKLTCTVRTSDGSLHWAKRH